ncbi:MAG TPA: hypothetical protein ENL40_02340 [Thermococcus litoralis]|uniref:Uncharacterized protein n=1 Tax=Thermococcus litoralis TaxID=2265 RepID=A0A7C5NZ45_THELI|nr:hypothetical protein [Thermococcus litoralis]
MWAHHLLPLPVSIQPTGRVFGQLPLPQSGLGLSSQRPPFGVLTAIVSSLERTLYSVFPPMMEGHDKSLWREYLTVASPMPYYVTRV